MKILLVLILVGTAYSHVLSQGKVGINTTTPMAMLHVKDSSVVFTGPATLPGVPGNPPVSGAGHRLMWYADKAAFRSGYVNGTQWDKANVGSWSMAAGLSCKASGNYSVALGVSTVASGSGSIAGGELCQATNQDAIAFGVGSISSGYASIAVGDFPKALGYASNSFGGETMAGGQYSSAFGWHSYSKSYACFTIGAFNDTTAASTVSWILNDPLFIIGNGTGISSRSNAFTVLKNGKTGINTKAPLAMLHVKDSSVVFTGGLSLPASPGDPPVSNEGIRMMWYPDKAAFRVGKVVNSNWNKANTGLYSFAAGETPKASGDWSVALGAFTNSTNTYTFTAGNHNTASGTGSVSLGNNCNSTGDFSFSMGSVCDASGDNAAVFGDNSTASGNYSFSAGRQNEALGFASTAFGRLNQASGSFSIAGGYGSVAFGSESFAQGLQVIASGDEAMALGNHTTASGSISQAFGYHNIANSFASMAIGRYNDTTSTSPNTWIATDPVFVIGNGTDSNTRSNAFTVLKNGNTGIGNASPAYALDVTNRIRLRSGGTGGTSPGVWLNKIDNSALASFIGMLNDSYVGIYSDLGASWNFLMNLSNGNIGIGTTPTQKLHVSGNGLFTGTVTASCGVLVCSDMRYKTKVTPLQNSLRSILGLHGIYYYWDKEKFPDKNFDDDRHIGIAAQELEKYFPEMVHTDKEGFKTVDYSRLGPVLIEAIKEQQSQLMEQQTFIGRQQEELNILQEEVTGLKKIIMEYKNK